uniref:Uncharacterized protein n=1 Tax=Euplotes crassus TaxID=5936 RepID=A0A7S3KJ88_EUPCR|mmetsp:Transcript_2709/g.2520  ORF Transcript_2709/g.2520 Transcript_2709/m.2520 type:complete len:131 (+) Transcript_2709:3036-3428(+)
MFKDTQDIDPEKSSEEESSEESSSENTEEAKIELPPFPGQSPLEGAGTLPVPVSKEGTPKPDEKKEASDVPKESTPAKEGTPAPPEDISRINFNPVPQAADPLTMTGASLVARDVHSLDQNPDPKEESKQ